MPSRAMRLAPVALVAFLGSSVAAADPWLAPGDLGLRHDLQLLADAGIVRTPVTSWPVSWGDVARDVQNADMNDLPGDELADAFVRVRRQARRETQSGTFDVELNVAGALHPTRVRGYESVPREDGEVGLTLDWTGERAAIRLDARAVSSPEDGKTWRADGSYAGFHVGNVMISAGLMEKWWGPGYGGSLILSTNARPVPSVTIERHYSTPFNTPVLAWLGPWRASFQAGRLESDRNDYPRAHLMALRIAFKPVPSLEVALSRAAQLCGEGRKCTVSTYWDMILGNDNDQSLDEQPGNQLAGFDARWSLARWVPLAVYGQAIGEDEAGFLPAKYLGLAGAETWGAAGRWSWRAYAEWARTSCNAFNSRPLEGCAYESTIYTDGYRYRGRAIGHAYDRDGDGWTLGTVVRSDVWTVTARAYLTDLNRAERGDEHTLAPAGAQLTGAELGMARATRFGRLKVSAGYDDVDAPTAALPRGLKGFLEWRYEI